MKKMLVICPHLSTGGSGQVTFNKLKLIKDDFIIKVIEYSNITLDYVVQRNRIINLVGKENFITLSDSKQIELQRVIEDFKPDIVSMEEFPEFFMDDFTANYLYSANNENRFTYKIFETTHDSSFDLTRKRFIPDKFIFVSPYNAMKWIERKFKYNIPYEVIEYPVDEINFDRIALRQKLGFEEDWKHIVVVGLFTERKNQGYAVELASYLNNYKIKFHFVGNMAMNFSSYWKPILEKTQNNPIYSNCIFWGEKDNAEEYIMASDLFLFCSKGDKNNKELNPIVIKEASQVLGLPKLIYNLDVYLSRYNNDQWFSFLTGYYAMDYNKIIQLLNPAAISSKNEDVIIVGTYPNLRSRVELTKLCIERLKPLGRKIMLVSHYPVSKDIQKLVDYYIFDRDNVLTHHSYYTRFFNHTDDYDVDININELKDSNQSLSVLMNLFTSMKAAKQYGFKNAFYITYDVLIHPDDIINVEKSFDAVSNGKKAYLATLNTPFGKGVQTTAMTFKIDYFLSSFHDVNNAQNYNYICSDVLKCQNFLEDYMMKCLFRLDNKDFALINNDKETFLVNSGTGVSSNSEYYSILPVYGTENKFMFYFYSYNIDDRVIWVNIENGGLDLSMNKFKISERREFKKMFEFTGMTIYVTLDFYDGDNCYKSETFEINNNNIEKYRNTGSFKFKNIVPKIKLVHIQTTNNDEKEKESRESLRNITGHNIDYILHKNVPYTSLPPKHNCLRPDCVSMELFDERQTNIHGTALTPSHYGCFEAFKNAILTEFDESLDYLIVCEGDCKLEIPMSDFGKLIYDVCKIAGENNIGYFSFGDTKTLEHGYLQSKVIKEVPNQDILFITDKIIGLQCIMFSKSVRKYLFESFRTYGWDAADIYFNTIFRIAPTNMGILHHRVTTQIDGFSLIDKQEKTFK